MARYHLLDGCRGGLGVFQHVVVRLPLIVVGGGAVRKEHRMHENSSSITPGHQHHQTKRQDARGVWNIGRKVFHSTPRERIKKGPNLPFLGSAQCSGGVKLLKIGQSFFSFWF